MSLADDADDLDARGAPFGDEDPKNCWMAGSWPPTTVAAFADDMVALFLLHLLPPQKAGDDIRRHDIFSRDSCSGTFSIIVSPFTAYAVWPNDIAPQQPGTITADDKTVEDQPGHSD